MSQPPAPGNWATLTRAGPADRPTVPGYEILGELGRGGMGVVYQARQLSPERLVALKLIRDGALASPQERARFRIEAEAAARVRHAHVVEIYAVGEHQGRPYFAMEFAAGGSLDKHLAGRPQDSTPAAELVRTLALAVQHAHSEKVIHRDLKPANVLLTAEGAEDRRGQGPALPLRPPAPSAVNFCPKITDFGLAKRLYTDSTAWTQDGAVLGTASYMAPEQAAGRVNDIGPAVDVYALGAILYELLTGRPPFQAESWNKTLHQVMYEEPAPPTRWHADVPRELETVCLKCLEKDPARRYASAAELADDLGRFLAGRPVAAVPLGEFERLGRLAARDGYHVTGEIGRGPRSTVYRAVSGPLQQPVALKVFAAGICTQDEWDTRLKAAADEWAAVAHPHVVPVQRAGWWDGVGYLAVEYVPQGSLAGKLTGRPYPLAEALRLVEQVADVIAYAHRQGVVHGNLKPSNILLAPGDVPRLVDFHAAGGLFHGPRPAGEADPAGCGSLAPELLRGAGAEPRPYTDIYGIGALLYELLTGRPPFSGPTARETLEQVRTREPEPPSRFNSKVTAAQDAFCLRCLRKSPWQRFYRAYDVLQRLRQLRKNADDPPDPGERRPSRRRSPERNEDPRGM